MRRAAGVALVLGAALLAPLAAHGQAAEADVQGRLTMKPLPPRKVANRYAGAGASTTALPDLPAVVYLRPLGRSAAPSPSPAHARMAQHDTAFVPGLLVVTTGSTVDFPNLDPFFHNVFSYSKTKRFDLGRYPRPEAKAVRFEQAGVVNVFCEIHRSMRGVILVLDHPYFAQVATDGTFRIRGVPAGRYEVVAWQADRGEKKQTVEVPVSGGLQLNLSL